MYTSGEIKNAIAYEHSDTGRCGAIQSRIFGLYELSTDHGTAIVDLPSFPVMAARLANEAESLGELELASAIFAQLVAKNWGNVTVSVMADFGEDNDDHDLAVVIAAPGEEWLTLPMRLLSRHVAAFFWKTAARNQLVLERQYRRLSDKIDSEESVELVWRWYTYLFGSKIPYLSDILTERYSADIDAKVESRMSAMWPDWQPS